MYPTRTQTITQEIEINYKPHCNQLLVHNDTSRFRVVVCGRRWGKTTLAVNEIIKRSMINNSNIFFIAPTYRQAKMIAFEMIKNYLPKEIIHKINEVDLEFNLNNGSKISLKGAENEDSLRGIGLDFAVLDEYAQMKPAVWQSIVRPMLTDRKGSALFIGTPKGKNSLFDLFLKGQRKEDGYSSYRFKTIDNPFIDPKEVEEAKTQLSDVYFRQEYEASFEDYTGLIYPEFNQKIHVIEQFPLPEHYETICAIDPAMTGTFACLFASIDTNGVIYFTSEYYEQNKRVSEVSQAIKGKTNRYIIDPASKDKTINKMGQLYSLFDEFSDNGIYPQPAENDVDAGINRVAEYFKQGKIKIFNNCKNLIYELERYHWSEEKETTLGLMKPKPYKTLDHLCDTLRYIIMSRASTPTIKQEQRVPYYSVARLNQESEAKQENWKESFT